jgi:hypothetical protein
MSTSAFSAARPTKANKESLVFFYMLAAKFDHFFQLQGHIIRHRRLRPTQPDRSVG